jgi:hypothetical protein
MLSHASQDTQQQLQQQQHTLFSVSKWLCRVSLAGERPCVGCLAEDVNADQLACILAISNALQMRSCCSLHLPGVSIRLIYPITRMHSASPS